MTSIHSRRLERLEDATNKGCDRGWYHMPVSAAAGSDAIRQHLTPMRLLLALHLLTTKCLLRNAVDDVNALRPLLQQNRSFIVSALTHFLFSSTIASSAAHSKIHALLTMVHQVSDEMDSDANLLPVRAARWSVGVPAAETAVGSECHAASNAASVYVTVSDARLRRSDLQCRIGPFSAIPRRDAERALSRAVAADANAAA